VDAVEAENKLFKKMRREVILGFKKVSHVPPPLHHRDME
jgi:hypothetical protein